MESIDISALAIADSKRHRIETLPYDILFKVVSYLPTKTVIAMCSLSRFWEELIQDMPTFWRDLEFITDGTEADDNPVKYNAKNAPEIVQINLADNTNGTVLHRKAFLSLHRFLARFDAIERNKNMGSVSLDTSHIYRIMYQIAEEIQGNRLSLAYARHVMCSITPNSALRRSDANASQYACGLPWELLRIASRLHVPLDMLAIIIRTAVEKGEQALRPAHIQVVPQSAASNPIVYKELRCGQLFRSLKSLVFSESEHWNPCPPRSRHEISQNLLARLLEATPVLSTLALWHFHVLSDVGSGRRGKEETLYLRQQPKLYEVDFSGTMFASGLPLLSDKCECFLLRRSPHVADFLKTDYLQRAKILNLSDNPDITDAILLESLSYKRLGRFEYPTGLIWLENCTGLEFSSQLLKLLYAHYHTIDISQNQAVTDDVVSDLLQEAAEARSSSPKKKG
ncbi:hypothetical protein BZA70DRAFT_152507 [Myxozyma melibiosi]|uniref:F-box domain-containing protein n=1 Tax=Myxozyma melibiosi TaxID=54550 RepID=A0ABR1F652_9ASCO